MISSYLWNKIAREILRAETETYATTLYLWLGSSPMNADGTGGTELSGSNYSRVAIVCNTSNWAIPSGKEIVNAVAVSLPVPSADWAEAVYAALIDTASGAGNAYFHDAIEQPFTNKNGQVRSFDAGLIVQRAL